MAAMEIRAVEGVEALFRRDDNNSTSSAASSSASATGDSSSASNTKDSSSASSDASNSGSNTASNTGSATGKSSSKGSGSSGSSGTAKTTSNKGSATSSGSKATITHNTSSYNASVGYGGVELLTPNTASSSSYYKIGDFVTFGWNLTSLSATPTAVDILATCSANAHTYTLALNQSVSASTGAVTWDTGNYQNTANVPLLTETYTLMIHDAAIDVSATPSYGHLSAYTLHAFAMYTKQAYTSLATEYPCVTCNGAMGNAERQTMAFMFGMVALTITSFTWFAGNFGII
ncbi:hypothetical protein BDV97DRAFT_377593 [Delphinella strobiligena]|nr:hypothetical protein BDV97DRAFT_377593 [Delphinella strobiligena]